MDHQHSLSLSPTHESSTLRIFVLWLRILEGLGTSRSGQNPVKRGIGNIKVHSRQEEHHGRSFELKQLDHTNKMVTPSSGVQGNLIHAWVTDCGSLCHVEKSQDANLHISSFRPMAWKKDAFQQPRNHPGVYVFPTFSLIWC